MGYRYKLFEMETSILWDEEDRTAHIYTASPSTMRKLDKMCAAHPDLYKCVWVEDGDTAKKYEVPAKYISFRGKVQMTDEQRAAAGERMKAYHEAQKAQTS